MSTSQNVNARTIVPTIVNLELVPVDSDLEEDLKEIQCKVAAEQAQIEEATRAKLAAAHECIEKKRQERKAEEVRKAEEAWKVEEDWVAKEKALDESWRWQLKVSCHCSYFWSGLISFQILKQKREAKKAQMVDIDGVSTGRLFTVFWN